MRLPHAIVTGGVGFGAIYLREVFVARTGGTAVEGLYLRDGQQYRALTLLVFYGHHQ
ncbi:MAG: hypothetical protein IJ808_08475 [Muribaculaceae bacterium]|nr:hypothetical protein [Muribaculaceae bacterium]